MFPVGLWHCTIHDFSFLSFRSLLSFHTLDSWRSTAATWPFMTFISFYSHYSGWTINLVMHLSCLTNGAKWPLISFFSLLVPIIPHGLFLSSPQHTQVFNLKIRSFRSSFKFVSMRSWYQPMRGNINYYYWTSWLFRTFSGVFVFVFQIICLFGFIINSWIFVWLRQTYKYHSQVWAVTKGFLLILHPVIRDCVKV